MSNVLVEKIGLERIASAIRNKNGLVSTYTPSQMASAINALEKSGFSVDDVADRSIVGNLSGKASFIRDYAFYNCSSLITVKFTNCTRIGNSAFYNCTALTTANFSSCSSIPAYAFQYCSALTTVSFPACTNIAFSAFAYCRSLISVNFPNCTYIESSAFNGCYSLTTANFPSCPIVGAYAFNYCYSLTTANFPKCDSIGASAFASCYNLISLYLNHVFSVTTLAGTSVFYSTPIGGRTTSTGGVYGSVFVPLSLLTSFKTATNWASISARIVGV